MFGYIRVNQDEMKIKDHRKYRGYYCGICHDLKKRTGQASRLTLTYDMTFLAILLSGLYEEKCKEEMHFCPFHPGSRQLCLQNSCTAYAADMNVLLTYHNLMDDWLDEKRKRSYAEARLLKRAYQKTAEKYPRQTQKIEWYLQELHRVEESASNDLDLAAGLTGQLMGEIFVRQEDIWSEELRRIGFFVGKYIYLMDAYEDVEKDSKNGNYNPFSSIRKEKDFDRRAYRILTMMAGEACKAFEKLPILENVDILRNVLYTGIWMRFALLQKEKASENEEENKK